uniref:Major facilitator superfamily (MFS) profile domain-containing protein n=1 Tax=Heliothis virescens TaxID=7102 RepID=A0A2A4JNL8_HELVI
MTVSGFSESKGHTRVQWAVTILCNMSLLTYGLQCGWVSPMTKILQSEESPTGRPLTDTEISWIASAPALAGVAGVVMFLPFVDRYGRKLSIIVMNFLQACVWIIKLLPASTTSLMVARVFCGLAGGGCFHIVPMYVKEIAQDNIRGTLASIFVLAQSAGIFIMYALGGFLDYNTVLWIVVGLPILTFAIFFKAPESPSYLVKMGKTDEAAATLALLRGMNVDDKEIQREVDDIKRDDEYFKSIPDISIITVFKTKAWRKAFLIMIMVILVHATNGGYSILNYASILLSDSGVTISPELQSLSIPICMIVGSLITMATIDRLGRKPILGIAFCTSAIAFASIATSIVVKRYGYSTPGWINVAMLMICVCCYGGGVSPIPFIVMPEIFNFQIRAKLMGYLVMMAWFMSFIQLLAFGVLTSHYGAHVGFYIFVGLNILGTVVAVVVMPETKGKSVEQIEKELAGEVTKDVEKEGY